jgi:HEAT repeat protein
LGTSKDPIAIPILIELLGFERPETEAEKLGVSSMQDKFPAVPALFSMGKPAVPALIDNLRTKDLDPVVRKNALRALIMLHRDNPPDAILELKNARSKAKLGPETDRLQSVLDDSTQTCPKSWRERCVAAAAQQH